jgi:hypothetical protein
MALELQTLLRDIGLEKTADNLSLRVYHHPMLPLVGFKYNQIDSPRRNDACRQARGIVFEKDTWKIIAKPFSRFFNVGEFAEDEAEFDWNNFRAIEKVDGSLVIVYHYDGIWHANTSGSFGLGDGPNGFPGNWRDMFWKFAGIDKALLKTGQTYIFELCTPWNKVVRQYPEPTVFLLGVTETPAGHFLHEYKETTVDIFAREIGVRRPQSWSMNSKSEVAEMVEYLETTENIDEGVVIRDSNGMRLKWKTDRYKLHHHLLDNGNIWRADRLTEVVLRGEQPEVLTSIPEAAGALKEVGGAIELTSKILWDTWEANKGLESQKDFALAVKDGPFPWVLFSLRKMTKARPYSIIELLATKHKAVAEKLFGSHMFQPDIKISQEEA